MNPKDYQEAAARTASGEHREERSILGIYGEREEYDADPDRDTGELGDIAWYIAECATAHGMDLDCVLRTNEPQSLAEARKKWLRGDYDRSEYLHRVWCGIGTQWRWLEAECKRRNLRLDDILRANIAKLADRAERGGGGR